MDQKREPSREPPNSDGQTGRGLPNDTGRPLEIDEGEARRIEEKIRDL